MPGVRVMDKDSQRQESVKGSFPREQKHKELIEGSQTSVSAGFFTTVSSAPVNLGALCQHTWWEGSQHPM